MQTWIIYICKTNLIMPRGYLYHTWGYRCAWKSLTYIWKALYCRVFFVIVWDKGGWGIFTIDDLGRLSLLLSASISWNSLGLKPNELHLTEVLWCFGTQEVKCVWEYLYCRGSLREGNKCLSRIDFLLILTLALPGVLLARDFSKFWCVKMIFK